MLVLESLERPETEIETVESEQIQQHMLIFLFLLL